MSSYRLLEHTADMGIAAEAGSLAEVFRQAALGLRRIITESPVEGRVERQLEVQGDDRGELLVNWLSELLYLFESEQFLPADFVIEIADSQLRARILGENVAVDRHELEREVKAVTYHQLTVEQVGGIWHAQVFVDL